jgi:hypothetical protein
MMQCQYCASENLRWFTPRSYAARAAVLLCMGCRRLTIVSPHAGHDTIGARAARAAA